MPSSAEDYYSDDYYSDRDDTRSGSNRGDKCVATGVCGRSDCDCSHGREPESAAIIQLGGVLCRACPAQLDHPIQLASVASMFTQLLAPWPHKDPQAPATSDEVRLFCNSGMHTGRYEGDISTWGNRRVPGFYSGRPNSESDHTLSSGLSPRDTRPRPREFDIEAAKKVGAHVQMHLSKYLEQYAVPPHVQSLACYRQGKGNAHLRKFACD